MAPGSRAGAGLVQCAVAGLRGELPREGNRAADIQQSSALRLIVFSGARLGGELEDRLDRVRRQARRGLGDERDSAGDDRRCHAGAAQAQRGYSAAVRVSPDAAPRLEGEQRAGWIRRGFDPDSGCNHIRFGQAVNRGWSARAERGHDVV